MRISIVFILITIFTNTQSQSGSGIPVQLYQKREGLCSTFPKNCPEDKQLNGICCLLNGRPQYYNNFCLACKDGCDSFVYKSNDQNENCGFEDL